MFTSDANVAACTDSLWVAENATGAGVAAWAVAHDVAAAAVTHRIERCDDAALATPAFCETALATDGSAPTASTLLVTNRVYFCVLAAVTDLAGSVADWSCVCEAGDCGFRAACNRVAVCAYCAVAEAATTHADCSAVTAVAEQAATDSDVAANNRASDHASRVSDDWSGVVDAEDLAGDDAFWKASPGSSHRATPLCVAAAALASSRVAADDEVEAAVMATA